MSAMNPTDAVNVLTFLERQVANDFGTPEAKASLQRVADHLKAQVARLTTPIGDGGSAFPMLPPLGPDGTASAGYPYVSEGMSLRDYFAAKAMAAMLANPDKEGIYRGPGGLAVFPRFAYEWADAMLAERQKAGQS